MKHAILIYSNPQTWGHPTFARTAEFQAATPDEQAEITGQFEELLGELSESGELIGGEPLGDPASARTVRVRGGAPQVTDGPHQDGTERLAGYFLVDCDSSRAVEIAARFPDARFAAVEVRPVAG